MVGIGAVVTGGRAGWVCMAPEAPEEVGAADELEDEEDEVDADDDPLDPEENTENSDDGGALEAATPRLGCGAFSVR